MSAGLEAQLKPLAEWLGRYINAHRFLWLMSLVCFVIAWNRGIALLYGLLALMLSLILISWVMPWWSLRKLSMTRVQQGVASAGQNVSLNYHFATQKPAFFLRLTEHIPGNSDADTALSQHFLASVSANDNVTLSYPCQQRGVFDLPPAILHSSWPFGFVQRRIRITQSATRIIVAPRVFAIRNLPRPVSDNALPQGADSFLSRSAHSEFAGVRPYRDGDSMKHVHWGASARQQQLVVREFHSYDAPSWLVVVDGQAGQSIGEGADNTFEYAIQIAASLLLYAQKNQLQLKVVVGSQRPLLVDVNAGARDISEQLQALAWAVADGSQNYQQQIINALNDVQDSPLLLTVRRDSQTLSLPPLAGHIDVVYNDESFAQPLKKYHEGWTGQADGSLRLDLHRLSKLAQVFSA
ncbi:DUF58 domain-containing protein [Thalassolituus marinus]|uniref:DUF58 domain-containing protein n=1 Tax=Thalassolituus marinus TaxID=671053 RepID=A0ABS7ZRU7_9GAMM|nr:DUF58 domain-containing protein [Thalassolituus marinus]MCA6063136.1 DUF58 domain-containing protein [Thalassolituus marinus]